MSDEETFATPEEFYMALMDVHEAMSVSLGHPYCDQECSHFGTCTLPKGHLGDHRALGLTGGNEGNLYCAWPQEHGPNRPMIG